LKSIDFIENNMKKILGLSYAEVSNSQPIRIVKMIIMLIIIYSDSDSGSDFSNMFPVYLPWLHVCHIF